MVAEYTVCVGNAYQKHCRWIPYYPNTVVVPLTQPHRIVLLLPPLPPLPLLLPSVSPDTQSDNLFSHPVEPDTGSTPFCATYPLFCQSRIILLNFVDKKGDSNAEHTCLTATGLPPGLSSALFGVQRAMACEIRLWPPSASPPHWCLSSRREAVSQRASGTSHQFRDG